MIPGCVVREAKTVRSHSEVSDRMTQTGSTEDELAHKKSKTADVVAQFRIWRVATMVGKVSAPELEMERRRRTNSPVVKCDEEGGGGGGRGHSRREWRAEEGCKESGDGEAMKEQTRMGC